MAKRALSAQETRWQIIDAAVMLHAERGVLRTKPADIAARANVALTTYYKHFPFLGSLVRACTTRGRELNPPPDPATVAALPPDPAVRVAAMVRMLFDYYEVREPWLYAGRTEARLVPELRPIMEGLVTIRDAFVRAALVDAAADREPVGLATALVDFWAWRTLRREVGLTQEEVIRVVTETVKRAAGTPLRDDSQKPAAPSTE